MRALVFQADAVMRRWLEAGLLARGHDVSAWGDPIGAREAYASAGHGLVLLDWSGVDGERLCREIRSLPDGRRSVVLAFGLSDRLSDIEAALQAGADDYLPGPADAAALEARLAVAEARARRVEARSRVEQDLRRLRKAVDTLHVGVSVTDTEGRIVYLNPAEAEMHGYAVEDLVGHDARQLSPPDTWHRLAPEELREARRWRRERVRRRRDGSEFPVQLSSDVVTNAQGEPMGLVTLCEDITERRQAEQALRESEERYALAVKGTNDGVWDWDLRRDRIYFSPRWKAMLGYAEEEISDSASEWMGRIHPEDAERVKAKVGAHLTERTDQLEDEHRLRAKDGSWRWVLVRGFALRDETGRAYRMAGAQTDITDRRAYDALTGLANRALFVERLGQALARWKRRCDAPFAVLFVDLDGFKQVNDSLGHPAGDRVLVEAARRIEACVRPGDVVSRHGGDEFAVLLDPIKEIKDATRVAERALAELEAPFAVDERQVVTGASVGIALSATGYDRPEDVLRDADAAMYRAKERGKGRYEVFDEAMRERVAAELRLEGELRRALESGELRLRYQPIVSLADRTVEGFEALVRWQHPERGLLPPAEFLPLAEETGLIVPIGRWILREACRKACAWRGLRVNGAPFLMNVNVSRRQLADPGFVETLRQTLEETALPPDRLCLEVSGDALAEAPRALERVRAFGVHLSLDGFGAAVSGLVTLRRARVDALKLDGALLAELGADGHGESLLRALLRLAHELGMTVIAEGVESDAQARRLSALHCEEAQGYFFSQPVGDDVAPELLAPTAERSRRGRATAGPAPRARARGVPRVRPRSH